MNQLLHTPEGVRDIYDTDCEDKYLCEQKMTAELARFGYRRIQTPGFEFFDIFGKEIGTTPSRDLFKFFDREGNTLVLRPDVTPSIARACATYFTDRKTPLRLFYDENVFINHSTLRGRLKEHTQIGGELIGDGSIDADAEIVCLAVRTLQSAGLTDFTVSIGHSDFFKGLVESCGFVDEEIETARELMINKNIFGLEELLKSRGVASDLRKLYSRIAKLFSEPKDWKELYELSANYPKIHDTLKFCEELYGILDLYGVSDHVSFELGLISRYSYYTGIIFSGYTYGSGEAVLSGGRYDKLLSYFGKDAPAIGFAINCDQLLFALWTKSGQETKADACRYLFYTKESRAKAIVEANQLRGEGSAVQLAVLPEDRDRREELLSYYSDKQVMIIEEA